MFLCETFYLQLTGKMKQMSGKPGEAIIEAAVEENADMIVVRTINVIASVFFLI
jgi:ribonucleotide monophosphatase NagD (HAD superfamily)